MLKTAISAPLFGSFSLLKLFLGKGKKGKGKEKPQLREKVVIAPKLSVASSSLVRKKILDSALTEIFP